MSDNVRICPVCGGALAEDQAVKRCETCGQAFFILMSSEPAVCPHGRTKLLPTSNHVRCLDCGLVVTRKNNL